ncbi:hypothetical protein O181_015453 [Austropuccinia psidii MF-1]|uniref:Integrase catalytic domain-containing protein n=1 Tax=Austropuccinia psidii MF-1 TaxID=1389203 RepID=A0A9Q3C392_9BASI|nr:hypothetical protein [Austropuccinia psidii MF-1]
MTIVNKAENIHQNSNGLSRWALHNTPDNPVYVPEKEEPQIPIEGINITDVGKELFKEVRESYKQDKNCHILTSLLEKDCKYTSLANSFDYIWKTSYDYGRFHLFDVILYHSYRDSKLALALWTNIHSLFGTGLSLSTAYHPQTLGLAERVVQTLQEMIRRFCPYCLELKYSYVFTHEWCKLIPALKLAYKTSIHASNGKIPAILEKGWNPKLPVGTLNEYFIDIHPISSSFELFLDKVIHHVNQSMADAIKYDKQKWDKSHKTPEFKVGDLILVSTLIFNNIQHPNKLKDSFSGPFFIKELHGTNAVKVELSGELENKHSAFLVSLVKCYISSEKELFPLGNEKPLKVPPLDQSEGKRC